MNAENLSKNTSLLKENNKKKPTRVSYSSSPSQVRNDKIIPQTEIDPNVPILDLSLLKNDDIEILGQKVIAAGLSTESLIRKQDLVFALLKWQTSQKGAIFGEGVLETFPDGYGFLREPAYNYESSGDDIYIAPSQIRIYGLRTGDTVRGQIRPPAEKERYYSMLRIDSINGISPEEHRRKVSFENLTPLYPTDKFKLETDKDLISTRIIDILCPIGKGQRALIVAPPRTGKTVLMQEIANAIRSEEHTSELQSH